MNPFLGFVLLKRLKAIRFLMKDPNISKLQKALVIFGILYLLMPFDLIPLPVLGFGLIDDLSLWIFILIYLGEQLDKYTPKDFSKKYKNSTVVDDADYSVDVDEKENEEDD